MSSVKIFWLSLKKMIRWRTVIIFLVAILITGLGYIFLKALGVNIKKWEFYSERAYPLVSDYQISAALVPSDAPSTNVIAAGAVVDLRGSPVKGATVKLSAYTTDGQLVWSTNSQTGEDGIFVFRESEIPPVKDTYGAVFTAEAPGYLADKKNVQVTELPITPPPDTSSQQVKRLIRITPSLNRIAITEYNTWLTIIVLMPAIFGLLFAILHLTKGSINDSIKVSYLYAFGTAALWSAVIAELIGVYVVRGYALIPLFWPDLFVSSGIVVFAFIGSIVYVAFSMHEKGKTSFFDSDLATKRKILLTMGGRVLVAPYIALTAYGIMAATFPTIRTGPFAAFFGFFTGLWIKVVLEMLNDIGKRFLSAESAQKVADLMKRTEVAGAQQMPSSSAADLKPDQAFLDAVEEARKELLQKENVIGVVPGFKFSDPLTASTQQAIIVYVYKKQDPTNEADRVPGTFHGFPTDVIALPPAGPDTLCHTVMSILSWPKIHKINLDRISGLATKPQTPIAIKVDNTQIILLVDPDEYLFNKKTSDNEFTIFDVMGAHEIVKPLLKNEVDFVSLAIDQDSGLSSGDKEIPDYHVPVFSDIEGINYKKPGNPGSAAQREEWGSSRLRACFVRAKKSNFSFYRYYHEFGHYWSAYVTFKKEDQVSDNLNLLAVNDPRQGQFHWNMALENNSSPVKNSTEIYVSKGNGEYEERFTSDEIGAFKYSQLDLYLMGLIPQSGVDPIRVLPDLKLTNKLTDDGKRIFTATPLEVKIEDIIRSCGRRQPVSQVPTKFRLAMVVVTKNQDSGKDFALKLEAFRKEYEQDFHDATSLKATLDTSIPAAT